MGRHILEPDEIGRRVTDDRVDIGSGQELLGANEIGHPARPRARRAAPQAFDGPKARGSPRLDQHDQSQTPGRKGANLIRLHRAADEAARFWRHWKTSRFDPGNTGGAVPRSEEHTSELQSLMRISYAVFCLKKKNKTNAI